MQDILILYYSRHGSTARLAEQIRAGEAVVLDDSGLFDKAIRAAINDIKELSVAS